eukprot:8598823-Lingulodinium_polyedra.AAC.1
MAQPTNMPARLDAQNTRKVAPQIHDGMRETCTDCAGKSNPKQTNPAPKCLHIAERVDRPG